MKKSALLFFASFIFCFNLFSTDTISIKNSGYRIGVKAIYEKSGNMTFSPYFYNTYNGGVQLIYVTKVKHLNFESGLYYTSKLLPFEFYDVNSNFPLLKETYWKYHFLEIPLNLRFDSKWFYLSSGFFVDIFLFKDYPKTINLERPSFNDNKFNAGINHNVGFQKKIKKQFTFFFELRFSDSLFPAYNYLNRDRFQVSFRNYGGSIGINYKIK